MARATHFLDCVKGEGLPEEIRLVSLGPGKIPTRWEKMVTPLFSAGNLTFLKELQPAALADKTTLVVFGSLRERVHREVVQKLGRHLRSLPRSPAALFIVDPEELLEGGCKKHLKDLLGNDSVHDVICGATDAFSLLFAIKAKLLSLRQLSQRMADSHQTRVSQAQVKDQVTSTIDFTQWQYLRSHLFSSIPPVRPNLSDADASTVAGFEIGTRLSRGVFGSLFLATRPVQGVADTFQYCAMLVVDKATQPAGIHQLKVIHRYTRVMQQLDQAKHPNISHLVAIFHSPKRLCICMEISGTKTLFFRLKRRDKAASPFESLPIRAAALTAIVTQAVDAVAHLHDVVRTCHRDIKPENFTIKEDGDSVQLKLGGFELAMVQTAGQLCKSACGTMPFAAPEAILANKLGYDGILADRWSLAMLFIEVMCGLRSIEEALLPLVNAQDSSLEPSEVAAGLIFQTFARTGTVEAFCHRMVPDAQVLRPWLQPLLAGLAKVNPEARLPVSFIKASLPESVGKGPHFGI